MGAEVNIIPKKVYDRMKKKLSLDEDFCTLVGFEGSKIKPFGKIKFKIAGFDTDWTILGRPE